MKWLIRHFLARTFDSEMFSARGQWGTVAVSALALLLPAGMILLETQARPGPARELTVLIRVLAIMGLMTLFTAPALFPTRRDFLALAALPLCPRQVFLARFAATLILALCATLALAVPLSNSVARLVTLTLGCLLIFFAVFAIHGLLLNFFPPRIATGVHGVLILICLGAGLATWTFSPIPAWTPPPRLLARATMIAIGSAVLTYTLAAARYRKLLIESPDGPTRRPRTWTFLRLLTQNPRRRAILEFIAAVIQRSRLHRMVLAGYAAAGLALMINVTLITRAAAHSTILDSIALYWPLGLSFVVLAGVRHAFVMPAELSANWIFQLTESQGRREWMSAVERFVICCVILPIHAVLLPIAGVRLITLDFLIALTMFELLFQSWQQLPFTCSYVPGKNTLMELLAAGLGIVCLVIPLLANLIALAAPSTPWFLVALSVCTAGWIWTRRQRREGWGEAPLIFVDTFDDVISLSGAGHRPAQASAAIDRRGAPALTLRIYRTLAHAFPEPFRDRYASDLLQLTEDSIESIWRRHGIRGLARLLFDLAIRLPIEHAADLTKDLRYGLRTLAASPGFTATALTALTLGICIATCAISEMNAIALREIPEVVRPHELIATQLPISYPAYQRFRAQSALFSHSAGYIAPVPFDVTLNQRTQRVWGHLVTASYFPAFGIRPALGSFFDASYDMPDRPPAVVLSHRFWRERFASDPAVIGRALPINGHPATILGVAAPEFLGASPIFFTADLFLPITTDPAVAPELAGDILERPGAGLLRFVARLRPETGRSQAEAALDTISRQFDLDRGASTTDTRARRLQLVGGGRLMPMRDQDMPFFTGFLLVMAGLVMLIACASVANMMLARAAGRRREIAVRLAIGASRARIIRQLVVESMLIATTAGLLGFLGSAWLMHLLGGTRMPFPMPVSYSYFTPDRRVLLMTVALTLITGVLFGLVPALQATGADLTPALKAGGETRLGRHRRFSVRNLLIVSQVAGSLTLLVILGLLSVGIQSTLGIQAGFNPAHLYLLSLDPVRDGYTPARAAGFLHRLLDRVQALPSVTAAALTESVPVSLTFENVTVSHAGVLDRAAKHVVGKDYFATTGIPILAGRPFRRDDETGQTPSVIVSASLAATAFPGMDPIGRRLDIGTDAPMPPRALPGSFDYRRRTDQALRPVEIVGVSGDVAEGLVVQKARPAMYFPLRTADYAQPSPAGLTLILRAVPGIDVLAQVRREIGGLDPNITTFNAGSMRDHIEEFMAMLRVGSWTYAMVGLFGYVLAAIGLAGVTAYAVQQRRREIGIRMALGARAGNVIGLVMKEGAVLVGIGVVIGLAGAWAGSRGLAAMNGTVGKVTSTSTEDPVVILGSTALLIVLALLACYLPARKSTSIDPVIALRQE